jgi:hypothetical protein
MKRILIVGVVGAAVLAGVAAQASAATSLTYRVTVLNRTPDGLTPLVYGVHDQRAHLWRKGRRATAGTGLLARDGDTRTALAELSRRRGVRNAGVTDEIASGRSLTFTVRTTPGYRRLSWASMLKCTNDGFTGVDSHALPMRVKGKSRFTIRRNIPAYDAGVEVNDESAASVPCLGAHGVGRDEALNIRKHPGIRGNDDLARASHGWGTAAARLTIRRIG